MSATRFNAVDRLIAALRARTIPACEAMAISVGLPAWMGVGTRIRHGTAVRRLTPRECERLMGLPDDFTLITYRGKPAADGPRYKSLGNSMALPVVRWILRRIEQCDAIQSARAAA